MTASEWLPIITKLMGSEPGLLGTFEPYRIYWWETPFHVRLFEGPRDEDFFSHRAKYENRGYSCVRAGPDLVPVFFPDELEKLFVISRFKGD